MLCTWRELKFSTLFFFTDQRPVNLGPAAGNPSDVYIRMLLRLAESLQSAGKVLRVFTNDPERMLAAAGKKNKLLQAEFLAEDDSLPKEILFWAAHHKLHVFRQFAKESWPNGFLDVDVVLTQPASVIQEKLERPAPLQAWVYDISDQVFPAHTRQVVQGDLAKLGATNPCPRWFGGEFLLGTPEFFQRLSAGCDDVLPRYLEAYKTLHHVSDEPVVSAVLNLCFQDFSIGEAGSAGLVARQWTGPTLHAQQSADVLEQSAFWHLPDLKPVLAREGYAQTPRELAAVIRSIQFKMKVRRQISRMLKRS